MTIQALDSKRTEIDNIWRLNKDTFCAEYSDSNTLKIFDLLSRCPREASFLGNPTKISCSKYAYDYFVLLHQDTLSMYITPMYSGCGDVTTMTKKLPVPKFNNILKGHYNKITRIIATRNYIFCLLDSEPWCYVAHIRRKDNGNIDLNTPIDDQIFPILLKGVSDSSYHQLDSKERRDFLRTYYEPNKEIEVGNKEISPPHISTINFKNNTCGPIVKKIKYFPWLQ